MRVSLPPDSQRHPRRRAAIHTLRAPGTVFTPRSGPVPARRIFFVLGIDFRLELYYLINVDSKNSRSLLSTKGGDLAPSG